ncbi:MAG: NAD-dependent epimerase/dehydratase family protein [Acidobacteriota bacterium]|nr:NAD-dependent epimerase/dehydratase family protein [Acidobacteriota bacterium]MDH3786668.1 NAD-dependent epimerase/dehydratase family protein [Acidobacteriota bacterium]
MKILVTGAGGFLGGAVVERLCGDGHDVLGFVRDEARWTNRPARAGVFVGDITDAESLLEAAAGCDVVIHAAALVKQWVRDSTQFDRVNVSGLNNVLQAVRRHDTRLLYVSSFIALGPSDAEPLDESHRPEATEFYNDYHRTKWIADQMARHAGETDVDLVRIYPGVVFGPGALTDGNHVVKLLLQHADGKLPGILGKGDRRQCFAYLDDVVNGIVQAVSRASRGQGFILGGENRTVVELLTEFERLSGVPVPRRHIPFGIAGWVGRVQRWRAMMTGSEPELTDEVVRIYRREWAYSSALAERELGYRVTPFAEAMSRTVEWLKATGKLS